MVRIVKKPEERKTEIMDIAEELFNSKGYEQTGVNEIIEKAGVAKGTFYYYFKSKDEILDEIVKRAIDKEIQGLQEIIKDSGSNALEKIKNILASNLKNACENEELLELLHKKENALMHQKSIVYSANKYSPIIAEIIKQGVAEGIFHTQYPLEVTQFLMVGISFLFDTSIFLWTKEEYIQRLNALSYILETTLHAEKGSFEFFSQILNESN
ncbi:MAG: TetR/AcrR family transcriptional regulator [Clostridia bacterium]|nr:TetR/AcrR family transcriptional regulator [Clostridia bacterium]